MKILEINKFYFARGGADRHFLDLVELLEAHGNEVAVLAMAHPKNLESKWSPYFLSTVGYTAEYNFGQKIKGVLRMYYSWEAKRKINKLLDDFQPDIVHIHNIYHQLSPAILPAIKKRGIPVIMTVHDYKLICPNYLLRGEKLGFWKFVAKKCFKDSRLKSFLVALEWRLHKFWKIYAKNIDLYIAPSVFAQNKLAQHGIPKNQIRVLPHFFGKVSKTSILGSMEVNDNTAERYAVYAGSISREKGVDTLIRIFKKNQHLKLYLAGAVETGFAKGNFKNIKYLGHLDKLALAPIVGAAGCVVSASRLPETFGLIALEAISAGKPFIGFNTGAYGEIIINGENGFLAKNKTAFREAVEKIARGEMVFEQKKILKSAKKYGRQAYFLNFSRLAQEVITGRPGLTK